MRVLVIGSTGLIGGQVVKALQGRHDVVPASRRGTVIVDIDDPTSIQKMYRDVGPIDAVVCAAGAAAFAPLEQLTDDDFALSLRSKLMGQVNVVRFGIAAVRDGGSFTITTGVLAQQPAPGSAAVSLVNAGLEGFVRAAALELPRGIRINAVSPGWIAETLAAMGRDPAQGVPASKVAQSYVRSVEGRDNATIISA
jgi:NAD(P)-dependent dehydrogenase (short-subunit alcohol dehydrogenase family)